MLYRVDKIGGDEASVTSMTAPPVQRQLRRSRLIVVREFGDPVYPGLVRTGCVQRGGDKPAHVVINAENFHALETLLYTHEGRLDVIYIDPPYNTRDNCNGPVEPALPAQGPGLEGSVNDLAVVSDVLNDDVVGKRVHDAHAAAGLRVQRGVITAGGLGRVVVVDCQMYVSRAAAKLHPERREAVADRIGDQLADCQDD